MKILKNLRNEIIEINGTILKLDEVLKTVLKRVEIKEKNDFKAFEKFGFEFAGEMFVKAGKSTVDDETIATIASAAIVAASAGLSGGILGLPAITLTTATVKPIIKGVMNASNPYMVKVGEDLEQKAADIK